eukprot:Blabericola_migrator_1__218@NODE_1057_length_5570_cov_23_138288_g727_i0_p3_GENE_NODE_1057_length_5570_cov_23_138288_g727_i0NODE_1057_length_5570_cov_23_138288_g727_i0_p3_ORF_typecomplete_len315_score85_72SNAP/PF14938_6/4e09SNAP/PF14938_6/4_8e02ChAPs/PF09295_10/6_9ChAPs/PF09295_10/0_59Phage_int_SAM_4/PF13495_6/0_2Phage_int_SAM_4/PF13495_6/4_9e02TPR_12/PF13424_6/0_054TPR_12/PF13424_6/1_9e02TPR_12/PF13424_6/1_6e03DUF3856/PF12968_7/0_045DUF3856/PF12968_7/9e03TPR_MalT/PF17874_1/0_19TPR_MalT/PF17874_1
MDGDAQLSSGHEALVVKCCKKPNQKKALQHYKNAAEAFEKEGEKNKAAEAWILHADLLKDFTKDTLEAAKAYDRAVTLFFENGRYTNVTFRQIEHATEVGVELYLNKMKSAEANALFNKSVSGLMQIDTDDSAKSINNIWKKISSFKSKLAENPQSQIDMYRMYVDFLARRQRWRECSETMKQAVKAEAYHIASTYQPYAQMLCDLFALQMDMKEIERTDEADGFLDAHAQDGPPAFRGSEEEDAIKAYIIACQKRNPSDAQRTLRAIAPTCSEIFKEMLMAKAKAKPLLISDKDGGDDEDDEEEEEEEEEDDE